MGHRTAPSVGPRAIERHQTPSPSQLKAVRLFYSSIAFHIHTDSGDHIHLNRFIANYATIVWPRFSPVYKHKTGREMILMMIPT